MGGAGKSTMIKCLLGELKPTTGTIMKVQGSRVAYMPQHAFHHIESHLDISATAYIMQRFAGGEDNESLENLANLGATKETDKQQAKKMLYKDGNLVECDTFYNDKSEIEYQKKSLEKAVDLEAIATRRKGKKEHEYECKWKGYSLDFLTWVKRSLLIEMGYKTQVQREDEKQAAMAGLQNKQLTTPGVEKHLADFGVTAEFATHNNLRALSAGQKSRSSWVQPCGKILTFWLLMSQPITLTVMHWVPSLRPSNNGREELSSFLTTLRSAIKWPLRSGSWMLVI